MDGRHDVNGDGVVDLGDLDLVMEVYGRSAWVYPPIPATIQLAPSDLPPSKCGDVNNDGAVNALNLALIDAYINMSDCPGLDINLNGVIDNGDHNVVLAKMMLGPNSSWCIGDINGNGMINVDDENALLEFLADHRGSIDPQHPEWSIRDINCDDFFYYREDLSAVQTRRNLLGDDCP